MLDTTTRGEREEEEEEEGKRKHIRENKNREKGRRRTAAMEERLLLVNNADQSFHVVDMFCLRSHREQQQHTSHKAALNTHKRAREVFLPHCTATLT